MVTKFNKVEYELVRLLKTMPVKKAAKEMGISPTHAYQILYRMRNKIENARETSNVAANWMKNKRLAKLLRRQETLTKEESQWPWKLGSLAASPASDGNTAQKEGYKSTPTSKSSSAQPKTRIKPKNSFSNYEKEYLGKKL